MADTLGAHKFETLFRRAAGLDVDKSDLKRLTEFVNRKLRDVKNPQTEHWDRAAEVFDRLL